MFYIISTKVVETGNRVYQLFDTQTKSTKYYLEEIIKSFIAKGMRIKNAKIVDNKLLLNEWYESIEETGYRNIFVLIGVEAYTDKFTLVDKDGCEISVDNDGLLKVMRQNIVGNCRHNKSRDEIEYIDHCDIIRDLKFEAEIRRKYDEYIAKAAMFTGECSFEYKTVGHHVTLIRYTGTSKEIILPNFITSIGAGAFYASKMGSIKLNNGIRGIGAGAFTGNNLSEMNIPDTVKYVGNRAFGRSTVLDFKLTGVSKDIIAL